MTATTTYAILTRTGEIEAVNLTTADAARHILSHDGCDYDIRRDDDGCHWLWSRQQVANRPWAKTMVLSWAVTADEAEAEIFAEVVGADWPRHPEAITMAQLAEMYQQQLADLEYEDDEDERARLRGAIEAEMKESGL